ncbi:SDR family oxidoreductase [Nonomuraea sp. NBC_01738]|uniref:NAD(P)-dependent oxidoreductase n=1 Tax=Nonomuraea sp. NBC_01738 TaxID=2976003 RepID=UPI002E143552|nr:SDR family oxidoreductase [Nonomuraea sp. NBC_01738]
MKLIVFGATGGTGRQVVEQALAGGHDVTVVARDPARVTAHSPAYSEVRVVQGDVLTPGLWTAAFDGQDAVLSCLGSTDRRRPTTVYSAGTAAIVAAMRASGVRRVVCLSSAGLEIAPDIPAAQRVVTRLVIQRLYRHGYADMTRMEQELARIGDLGWTVVRPPMLTDGPLTAAYRTAEDGHVPRATSISRADLAHFLLTQVTGAGSPRAVVEISG